MYVGSANEQGFKRNKARKCSGLKVGEEILMRTMQLLFCWIIAGGIGVISPIMAQSISTGVDTSSAPTYRIVLYDGSELIGTIISRDSLTIKFKTLSSIGLEIPLTRVVTIEQIFGSFSKGEFRHADPNHTRLFFAPTGRGLRAGQGYFSSYELFFPFLAYGATDFLTLAGGVSVFPGTESQIYFLAPKVNLPPMGRLSVAAGVLYINSTASSGEGVGVTYGVGTYGSENSALTVGLGWGFSGGTYADKPVLVLGGEARLSKYTKLITENWIPPNSDGMIYSFGLRFFGENLAADLGFFGSSNSQTTGFPFFPWVSFAYNFGTRSAYRSDDVQTEAFDPRTRKVHISAAIGMMSSRGTSSYKSFLEGQGFNFSESGLFSSSSATSSSGSGMNAQVEYSLTENVSAGIAITTLGNIIGGAGKINAYRYLYDQYYYNNASVEITHRISGYYVYGAYTFYDLGFFGKNVTLQGGGGLGKNVVDVQYGASSYFGMIDQANKVSIQRECYGGMLFATIEQWISPYLSIGLTGSYTFLPSQSFKEMTFDIGSHYDYLTSPPAYVRDSYTLPAHSINFSFGKVGLVTRVHL